MADIQWIARKEPYAKRVEVKDPLRLPDIETLKKSRNGLTRRMIKESNPENRYKLKVIRDEFDFLIEML